MRKLQLLALLLALSASTARADDEPPPVKRTPPAAGPKASAAPAPARTSASIAGSSGLRPIIGAAGHLDVDKPTAAGGSKLIFGAEYGFGGATGFAFVLGLHLGAGGQAFLLYPLAELHYRFALPIPLVPWIGGGAGARVAFKRDNPVSFALGFRFVAGVDYFFTDAIGLGTQVAVPDIGPLLSPEAGVVGTVEWTLGPHFRF